MNISQQIEPASTDHLLTSLGLAIGAAKLSGSTIKSRDMASNIRTVNFYTEKSAKLEREIAYLEAELSAVREQVKKMRERINHGHY